MQFLEWGLDFLDFRRFATWSTKLVFGQLFLEYWQKFILTSQSYILTPKDFKCQTVLFRWPTIHNHHFQKPHWDKKYWMTNGTVISLKTVQKNCKKAYFLDKITVKLFYVIKWIERYNRQIYFTYRNLLSYITALQIIFRQQCAAPQRHTYQK